MLVNPIRIHLAPMPAMLLAIVEDMLAAESDFVVVGHSRAGEDALGRARRDQADVLITHDGGEGGTCLADVLADPPLGILSIAGDGRAAAAVSLARRPVALEGNGGAPFAAAIRRACAGP